MRSPPTAGRPGGPPEPFGDWQEDRASIRTPIPTRSRERTRHETRNPPDYHPVVFRDATTGHQFLARSTATSTNTVEWTDGNTYPLIVVEISAYPHPWWTGTRRVLDAGRPG